MKAGATEGRAREFEHFPNLVTMFFTRAAEKGEAPFLWAKQEGGWAPLSWRAAAERVASLAAALRSIGLGRGDRVMLVSENRPEWCIADLAVMASGCVTVPAYITNTERDHLHILEDSGARAVIVSTQRLAKPLLPAAFRSNSCEHVIGMEPIRGGQSASISLHDWNATDRVRSARRRGMRGGASFGRDDLACIVYTSGTGGARRAA